MSKTKKSSETSEKKEYGDIDKSMKKHMAVSHILEEVKTKFPRPTKTLDLIKVEDIDIDTDFPEEDDISNADELEHVDPAELPPGEYVENPEDEDPYCTPDGSVLSDPKMWPSFLDNAVYRLQDRYKIQELLMNKSFRKVYRAKRKKDGKPVVIVVSSDLQAEYVRHGVPREVRIMTHLKGSKYMGQLLEWARLDPTHFVMVLEHYLDCDLFVSVAGNNYAISLVAKQLLHALKELDEAHIAHRDIAFENVLWNAMTEELKVIDFESSSFYHRPGFFRKTGHTGFIAPEKQYIIDQIDIASEKGKRLPKKFKGYTLDADLYSVGVMLWMLFQDETDAPKPKVLHQWVKTASKKKKHKKYPAVDLIIKLLQKDPKNRINLEDALEHPFVTDTKPDEEYENMRDQLLEMIADEDFQRPHEASDEEEDSDYQEATSEEDEKEEDQEDWDNLEEEEATSEEDEDEEEEEATSGDEAEKESKEQEDHSESENEEDVGKYFSDDEDENADKVSVSSEEVTEKKKKKKAEIIRPSTPVKETGVSNTFLAPASVLTAEKPLKSLEEIMKGLKSS